MLDSYRLVLGMRREGGVELPVGGGADEEPWSLEGRWAFQAKSSGRAETEYGLSGCEAGAAG